MDVFGTQETTSEAPKGDVAPVSSDVKENAAPAKQAAEQPGAKEQAVVVEQTEGQKIAQEALAAAGPAEETKEEKAEAGVQKERSKTIGEITALRANIRDLKAEEERLKKENAERQAKTEPDEISPYEKFVEDNPDELDVPPKVQAAQIKWNREQAAKKDAKATKTAEMTARRERLDKAEKSTLDSMAKLPGFKEITEEAASRGLMTAGDRLDFSHSLEKGKDSAKLIYTQSINRILQAGGDPAKQLRAYLTKVAAPKASAKQEPTTGGSTESTEQPEVKDHGGGSLVSANIDHIFN